jgi:TRAP-type C4-dicarboxylate transport system substrate-binding protein
MDRLRATCAALTALLGAVLTTTAPGVFAGELPAVHLKVVGGLGATSQYRNFEEPFWTKRLAERSHGRVTAEVAPFDQQGIRAPEVIQLTKLGVINFSTVSLSALASEDPEATAADFVGLNGDIAALRRNLESYRQTLTEIYRERYGVEVLSIWTYPAQVVFCKRPVAGLRDLVGLKVRTASVMQADLIEALGGVGITLPYAGIADAMGKGVVDCAITGAISGYVLGLPRYATHLLAVTVNWGPNILVANRAAWQHLAPELRAFIRSELDMLDDEIWAAAKRETQEGIACNTGEATCSAGKPAQMKLVPVGEEDQALIRGALKTVILPRWADRCGPECARAWNESVGRAVGLCAVAEP